MEDYTKQAEGFLKEYGTTFKATRNPANRCPLWCNGKHIHGNQYLVTFKKKGEKSLNISFWNSLRDKQNKKSPEAYDVLTAITKNDPGTFEDFCADFGYDTDSRKAEKIYKLVRLEWDKVSDFFCIDGELEDLREIQ